MEQQLTQENNKSTEASSNVALTPGKMRVIKETEKLFLLKKKKLKLQS